MHGDSGLNPVDLRYLTVTRIKSGFKTGRLNSMGYRPYRGVLTTVAVFPGLLLGLLLLVTPVNVAVITINNPSPAFFGYFGRSIDSANGLLVVGAPFEPVSGVFSVGQAWVFNAKTGSVIRTLVSSNGEREGNFGNSVELADNLLIIGAPGETVNGFHGAGRVYVFSAETGSLVSTLVSPNAQTNGDFGGTVNQANGLLTVGAPFETANGFHGAGRVYVFSAKTGSLVSTLVSPNAQLIGEFGISTEILDGRVIVGADGESVNGFERAGRAYVFSATTGSLIIALSTANAEFSGLFGDSVAMTNQEVFVGADAEAANGLAAAGRIYVFNVTTGLLIRTLISPDALIEGRFGFSFELADGRMIVGASSEMGGRVYVFSAKTGSLESTLVSPNNVEFGQFGLSVELANGSIYVGAPGETVDGLFGVGSAYIFHGAMGS